MKTLYTSLFAVAAGALASAQSGSTYNSQPDVVAIPSSLPNISKMSAANITSKGYSDLITLQGSALYLVHGAGVYARWEPIASSGVTDFVVIPHGASGTPTSADCVVFSTASGLSSSTWGGASMVTTAIPSSSGWIGATNLCTVQLPSAIYALAGVKQSTSILQARWSLGSALTSSTSLSKTAAVTSLALADYNTGASSPGVELASVSGSKLEVRNDVESLIYDYSAQVNTSAAQLVARNPSGGTTGDSILFLCTAPANSGSLQYVYELFPGNTVSAPAPTFSWSVSGLAPGKTWKTNPAWPTVTARASNSPDLFRVADTGAIANAQTLNVLLGSQPDNHYWQIRSLVTVPPTSAAIPDAPFALGDFDHDGLDDVLLLSQSTRQFYLYHAWDDWFGGTLPMNITQNPTAPTGLTFTLSFTVQLTGPQPRNFNGPPDKVEAAVWLRNGLVQGGSPTTIDPTPVAYAQTPVTMVNNVLTATVNFSITTNYAASNTLIYMQVAAIQSSPFARGNPVGVVTVQNIADAPEHDLLCSLMSAEPDSFSTQNRVDLNCPGANVGPSAGNAVILTGGFQRRSSIGPFPAGSGSPLGGH